MRTIQPINKDTDWWKLNRPLNDKLHTRFFLFDWSLTDFNCVTISLHQHTISHAHAFRLSGYAHKAVDEIIKTSDSQEPQVCMAAALRFRVLMRVCLQTVQYADTISLEIRVRAGMSAPSSCFNVTKCTDNNPQIIFHVHTPCSTRFITSNASTARQFNGNDDYAPPGCATLFPTQRLKDYVSPHTCLTPQSLRCTTRNSPGKKRMTGHTDLSPCRCGHIYIYDAVCSL